MWCCGIGVLGGVGSGVGGGEVGVVGVGVVIVV